MVSKNTFNKIVTALKDINFSATIHLSDDDKITIALGRDYFKKGYNDEVENRLKKAGIQNGYNLPAGIGIMADSSVIGDRRYTKAQYEIRGSK